MNSMEEFQEDQAKRLHHVEKEVSGLSVQLKSISETLSTVSTRMNRPTNWLAIGGFAIVCFGAMITFIALNLRPIEAQVAAIRADAIGNQSEISGKVVNLDVHLQREMRLLDDLGLLQGRMNREVLEQRLLASERLIEDIDKRGSRKWMDFQQGEATEEP